MSDHIENENQIPSVPMDSMQSQDQIRPALNNNQTNDDIIISVQPKKSPQTSPKTANPNHLLQRNSIPLPKMKCCCPNARRYHPTKNHSRNLNNDQQKYKYYINKFYAFCQIRIELFWIITCSLLSFCSLIAIGFMIAMQTVDYCGQGPKDQKIRELERELDNLQANTNNEKNENSTIQFFEAQKSTANNCLFHPIPLGAILFFISNILSIIGVLNKNSNFLKPQIYLSCLNALLNLLYFILAVLTIFYTKNYSVNYHAGKTWLEIFSNIDSHKAAVIEKILNICDYFNSFPFHYLPYWFNVLLETRVTVTGNILDAVCGLFVVGIYGGLAWLMEQHRRKIYNLEEIFLK